MKTSICTGIFLVCCVLFLSFASLPAEAATYGQRLCHSDAGISCLTVQRGDTWTSLWPDPTEREKATRLNRSIAHLEPGMQLAIPDSLSESQMRNLLPFSQDIGQQETRTIIVSPRHLAWAAYDEDGRMVRWGPASTGRDFCPDINSHCRTPRGVFTIYRKEGEDCISTKFPVPRGGAPMPYCMYFKGGFAIHGSNELPGYNASHGCIRTRTSDAYWLNQEFIQVGSTRVIVRDD